MTSGRKLNFRSPDPAWPARRRHRTFGQDDGSGDYGGDMGSGGADYGGDPNAGTTVSEVVVTAAAPSNVDVQPQQDILASDYSLSPPAPLDISNFTSDLPSITLPGGASNPLNTFLKKLFPGSGKPAASSGGKSGGGGGGSASAPKLQPASQVKPATSSTAINPALLLGAGAAGIVLLAALLSSRHGGDSRR